jgi:hypothetical protein
MQAQLCWRFGTAALLCADPNLPLMRRPQQAAHALDDPEARPNSDTAGTIKAGSSRPPRRHFWRGALSRARQPSASASGTSAAVLQPASAHATASAHAAAAVQPPPMRGRSQGTGRKGDSQALLLRPSRRIGFGPDNAVGMTQASASEAGATSGDSGDASGSLHMR